MCVVIHPDHFKRNPKLENQVLHLHWNMEQILMLTILKTWPSCLLKGDSIHEIPPVLFKCWFCFQGMKIEALLRENWGILKITEVRISIFKKNSFPYQPKMLKLFPPTTVWNLVQMNQFSVAITFFIWKCNVAKTFYSFKTSKP